jgi:hypothetical protein
LFALTPENSSTDSTLARSRAAPPEAWEHEVGRTLEGVHSHVPASLEDQLCEECQNSVVTVILSSGQALCVACAAIRFRIPTTDRAKLRAAIEAGTSVGAHWPRNS